MRKNIKEVLMDLVRVKTHYQITLPNSLRKKFNINLGDFLEVESKDGQIIMRPMKLIRTGQDRSSLKKVSNQQNA